jgi:hypothetical protein
MAKAQPRSGATGTGGAAAERGHVIGLAGPVTPARAGTVVHRLVPAHPACRIASPPPPGERDAWPAVASIALGVFALVFSELIPVGLLADISGLDL